MIDTSFWVHIGVEIIAQSSADVSAWNGNEALRKQPCTRHHARPILFSEPCRATLVCAVQEWFKISNECPVETCSHECKPRMPGDFTPTADATATHGHAKVATARD